MQFETLADLVEAYKSGDLSSENPLIVDEDSNVAYVEVSPDDETKNGLGQNRFLFYISFTQFIIESVEFFGITWDSV